MSKLRLEGKVAIITGAASGIGEASARLFVENGAFVVIADIQDELGHQVVASIGSNKASYKHCDVRIEKQVEEVVELAMEKYGALDIMYSNAGIGGPLTSILEMDMEKFNNTMSTNVSGMAMTIKHASRVMVKRKTRGSIICTASVAGVVAGLGPHEYTASKHAILGLVKSACSELGTYGIRINSISPSGVATPFACEMIKLEPNAVETFISERSCLKGIHLKAKHIAEAALFLASEESVFMNGHNLVVDGGLSVASNSYPVTADTSNM